LRKRQAAIAPALERPNPGGNVANTNDPNGAAIKNAFVAGLRSTVKF
jgi:hypothetical protein